MTGRSALSLCSKRERLDFLAPQGRQPFVVPEAVPWPKAAMALNTHFGIFSHSALKDTDLYLLQRKLGGRHTAPVIYCGGRLRGRKANLRVAWSILLDWLGAADKPEAIVTWTMFNRSSMPGYAFAFWEWFFAAEELVKRHLHQLWPEMYESVKGAGYPACCSRLTIPCPAFLCTTVASGWSRALSARPTRRRGCCRARPEPFCCVSARLSWAPLAWPGWPTASTVRGPHASTTLVHRTPAKLTVNTVPSYVCTRDRHGTEACLPLAAMERQGLCYSIDRRAVQALDIFPSICPPARLTLAS